MNADGDFLGWLKSGTKIATSSSKAGKANPGHMSFNKKLVEGCWEPLVDENDAPKSGDFKDKRYGFVCLDIPNGTLPNNRAIW